MNLVENTYPLAMTGIFSLLLILLGNGKRKSLFPVRIIASWTGMCLIYGGYSALPSTVIQEFEQVLYMGMMCLMFLLVYVFCYHVTIAEGIYMNLLGLIIFEMGWNVFGCLKSIQTSVCLFKGWRLVEAGIICTSVCFCAYGVYRRFCKRIPTNISAKSVIPTYLLLMICTMVLELCRHAVVNDFSKSLLYYICALMYSFVSYAAWLMVMQVIYYRQAHEEMNCFLRDRTKYYEMSRETIQSIQMQFHDLKHQMMGIRSQCGRENLEKYLSDLEKSIELYGTVIECGNEALNIVLTEKNIRCAKSNINLFCMVDGTAFDFLSETEIYSLFGNVLDNAQEGCMAVNIPEKRRISLKAGKRGDMVILLVENFFKGNISPTEGLPRTTKKEMGHGFGLKSVQAIAEKYGGTLSVQTEGDVFRLSVVMNPMASSDK